MAASAAAGASSASPRLELKKLETIFRHQALKMLLRKGEDYRGNGADASGWKHAGLTSSAETVSLRMTIRPWRNLARYIIQAPFPRNGCST